MATKAETAEYLVSQIDTDAGPVWIGAGGIWDGSATGVETMGEGLIIGMIDTGIKDRQSTFAFMDEETLRSFSEKNKKLGLGTALAGAVEFEDIEALKRINPDIIGVRGMVCGGDRNATVREDLIKTALAMIAGLCGLLFCTFPVTKTHCTSSWDAA